MTTNTRTVFYRAEKAAYVAATIAIFTATDEWLEELELKLYRINLLILGKQSIRTLKEWVKGTGLKGWSRATKDVLVDWIAKSSRFRVVR